MRKNVFPYTVYLPGALYQFKTLPAARKFAAERAEKTGKGVPVFKSQTLIGMVGFKALERVDEKTLVSPFSWGEGRLTYTPGKTTVSKPYWAQQGYGPLFSLRSDSPFSETLEVWLVWALLPYHPPRRRTLSEVIKPGAKVKKTKEKPWPPGTAMAIAIYLLRPYRLPSRT